LIGRNETHLELAGAALVPKGEQVEAEDLAQTILLLTIKQLRNIEDIPLIRQIMSSSTFSFSRGAL